MIDHEKNLAVSEDGPPWFVYDLERRANVAGLFPTRYQAEDARLRMIDERRRADAQANATPWQRMPWQWKLGLVRVTLAALGGFCAAMWAAYQVFTGDYVAALGIVVLTVVGVRLVGGALLDIDRIDGK